MKTKHTKGKWVLFKGTKTEGKMPNGMTFEVWRDPNHKKEEAEANAKLIASSPELLETIIQLQKGFSEHGQITGGLYEYCQKAIDKATI